MIRLIKKHKYHHKSITKMWQVLPFNSNLKWIHNNDNIKLSTQAFIKERIIITIVIFNRKDITSTSNSFTHPSFLPSALFPHRVKTFVMLVFLLDFVIRFLATLILMTFSLEMYSSRIAMPKLSIFPRSEPPAVWMV